MPRCPSESTADGAMVQDCHDLNFTLAGVEDGQQCFCGDQMHPAAPARSHGWTSHGLTATPRQEVTNHESANAMYEAAAE